MPAATVALHARADLLRRAGWLEDARIAYKRAIQYCENTRERTWLQTRLDRLFE